MNLEEMMDKWSQHIYNFLEKEGNSDSLAVISGQ
jgi:hypothetical protein